jgi:hypothetical protein
MKCAERLYGLHADIPGKNQPGEVGEFTQSMRYDLISQVSKPLSSDSKGFVGSLIERAASPAARRLHDSEQCVVSITQVVLEVNDFWRSEV